MMQAGGASRNKERQRPPSNCVRLVHMHGIPCIREADARGKTEMPAPMIWTVFVIR